MLLPWLSIALANSACVEGWWATAPPVDLRTSYVERHRELTWQVSSGRGASPVFREPWARMDVDLWLRAQGQDGLVLGDLEQKRIRDLTLTAATLAGEVLLEEVVQGNEVMTGVQFAARSLISPTLSVGDGVRLNQGPTARYRQQLEARLSEPGLRPPPQRKLTIGAGSSVVTDELDPDALVGVAWTTFLTSQRIGPDRFRVGVDVLQWYPGADLPPDWSLAWTVNARHAVHPRWALVGDARSVTGAWQPRHLRSGLEHKVVKKRRVYIRGTYTHGFEQDLRPKEHRADLRMTWTPNWRTPAADAPAPWDEIDPYWNPRAPRSGSQIAGCPAGPHDRLAELVVAER